MQKLFILNILMFVGCMSDVDAKKHNIDAFKTPEIVGEIDGNEVYHYTIYNKFGDTYVPHHVYYVKGKDTITTNGHKAKHVNIVVDGVEYAPIQSEINE